MKTLRQDRNWLKNSIIVILTIFFTFPIIQCSDDVADDLDDTDDTGEYGQTPQEQIQFLEDNEIDYYLDEFGNPYTQGEMLIQFDEGRDEDKLDLIRQELAIINEVPVDSITINECGCGQTDLVLLQYKDKLVGNLEPAIGSMGDQDGDDDGLSTDASVGVTTSNNYYNSPLTQFLNGAGDDPRNFGPANQSTGEGHVGNNTDRIVIAVLDSGLDFDHPSLPHYQNFSLWMPPAGSCYELGYDFVNNIGIADDNHGHGTQVTSVILDALDPYDVPVAIMPLKISSWSGAVSLWDMYCAINFAVQNGANIVNISAGWYGAPNIVIHKIIEDHPEILFVVSAGNEGFNTDIIENTHFPSGFHMFDNPNPGFPNIEFSNLISVGAMDETRSDLAWFSNFGKLSIGIVAAGENITASTPCDGPECADSTTVVSGTSFSAPYVTAVAAAMMKCLEDPTPSNTTDDKDNLYQLGIVNPILNATISTGKELYLPDMIPFIPCLR